MTQVILTREQQRAQHALQSVTKVQTKPKKYRDEFKSYAESLPANIVMNGLGQACAMLLAQARGKSADQDAYRLLYDHLQDWILGRDNAAVYPNDQDLVKAVINHGQGEYVRAQFESLAYLNWLKKFAQAYLTEPEAQHGEAK